MVRVDLFSWLAICLYVSPLAASLIAISSDSVGLENMFMVLASILVIAVLVAGFEIPDLFWMLAILNFFVAIYIMKIIPKQSLKTLGRVLFKLLYRVEVKGLKNYPQDNTPHA